MRFRDIVEEGRMAAQKQWLTFYLLLDLKNSTYVALIGFNVVYVIAVQNKDKLTRTKVPVPGPLFK